MNVVHVFTSEGLWEAREKGGHNTESGKNIPQNKTSLLDNLIW